MLFFLLNLTGRSSLSSCGIELSGRSLASMRTNSNPASAPMRQTQRKITEAAAAASRQAEAGHVRPPVCPVAAATAGVDAAVGSCRHSCNLRAHSRCQPRPENPLEKRFDLFVANVHHFYLETIVDFPQSIGRIVDRIF